MLQPIQIVAGQPRRFGDYLLHKQLGAGGMAFVYEGEEVLSRRPVAVKVLRTELAADEPARRRFLNEMAILANVDHPHVVRCLACREIEGRLVMVLERLDGWTLREMLGQRVALPWQEALRYAMQIARALDAAHSRKPAVVHRDLKPENVMILADGHVKVMDFGIAKVLQSFSHATSQSFGTPQYMSPEQIDARAVDPRSDLFALGLVLWEMLAGWPPFVADSPRVLMQKVCAEPAPRLPDRAREGLPFEVETLIERLLAKDPNGRPGTAAEVVEWIEFILSPRQNATVAVTPRVVVNVAGQRKAAYEAKPQPQPQPQPAVVEADRGSGQVPVADYVDGAVDIVDQFAQATSALIVRLIMGALIFIPAAVVSACVSLLVALFGVGLLENDGVKLPEFLSLPWMRWELGVGLLGLAAVVYVRACWAHRRAVAVAAEEEPGPSVWNWLGGLSIFGWAALTVIELVPDSNFNATGHSLVISWCTTWLFLTLVWAMGRMTSRMLHNIEQSRVRH
jgi:tRNA A-37 threonylcarbamoyl transferase component Bud32